MLHCKIFLVKYIQGKKLVWESHGNRLQRIPKLSFSWIFSFWPNIFCTTWLTTFWSKYFNIKPKWTLWTKPWSLSKHCRKRKSKNNIFLKFQFCFLLHQNSKMFHLFFQEIMHKFGPKLQDLDDLTTYLDPKADNHIVRFQLLQVIWNRRPVSNDPKTSVQWEPKPNMQAMIAHDDGPLFYWGKTIENWGHCWDTF